jgi:hypothetical protein
MDIVSLSSLISAKMRVFQYETHDERQGLATKKESSD